MNVGIGLPIGLPICDPELMLTWARRVDASPFSSLGILDRLVYHNPEPLITLAAIATATSRVRVQTEVLLAPLREPVLLAKQIATLDCVSSGRLTLGIGVGGREDDFVAAGIDYHHRGRRLDEQMALMRRIWAGEPYSKDIGPVGPMPTQKTGPEILFGGFTPAALERVSRWGDGYLCAAPLQFTDHLFRSVERSWQAAGRAGRPRLVNQIYAAIGPDSVVNEARDALYAYFDGAAAPEGDFSAQGFVDRMLTTPEKLRAELAALGDLGADEVVLYCWSHDPDQIDRLADILP